jgi:hypothetical protein
MPGEQPPKVIDPNLENDNPEKDPIKTEQEILDELKDNLEKVAFVDVSEIAKAEARDAGESNITEEREKTKGLGNFFKRVWKHNIMRDYNRFKEISKVKKQIKETENIYAGETDDREHHEMAMTAITERFLSEYEGVVKEEAGEKKDSLEKLPNAAEVKADMKRVVLDYATGKLNDASYAEERTRILQKITKEGKGVVGDGEMYADNMKEVAQNVKAALDHGISLEKIDAMLNFDVTIGQAQSGVRTEAKLNVAERATEKIHKSKLGALVGNETTIAAAVFATDAIVAKATQSSARVLGKATGFFGGIAVAAGISAYKENRRFKQERAQHIRETAKGKEYGEDAPRREHMDGTVYEMRTATQMTEDVLSRVYVDGNPESGLRKFESKEELNAAMAAIAEAESRINLSNREKIDLVVYSGSRSVEVEKRDMEIALARAKVDVRKQTESNEEVKALLEKDNFNDSLKVFVDALEKKLEDENISEADKEFKRKKLGAVLKAAGKGALSAAIVGTVIQEVSAFFSDRVDGLAETLIKGQSVEAKATTALQGFREYLAGESNISVEDMMKGAEFGDNFVGDHNIELPVGTELVENADGTFNLVNGGNVVGENIPVAFDADGSVSAETMKAFEDAGMLHAGHDVRNTIEYQETVVTPEELVKQKYEGLTKVARDLWYDNDTEGPIFDKNELGTWWGGENNTGIDSDGNFVFNISHMTEDGSYHGGFSADAQELVKKGGVKMLFSMTRGTQDTVFEVPIDVNGNAVVDPDSEIGKMFFSVEDGKAVFQGRFAEVAQMMGSEDGVEHVRILSTVEGNGIDGVNIVEEVGGEEISDKFVPDQSPRDIPWEYPPAIPLVGRFPLEPMKDKEKKKPEDPKPKPVDPTPEPVPVNPEEDEEEQGGEDEPTPEDNPYKPVGETIFYERMVSEEEYKAMKDDLILINTMIQSHEGILNLEKDQLQSDYAKERYDDLKHIPDGVPARWNKYELQIIGDELEAMLSGSEKLDQKTPGFNDKFRNVFDLKQKYQSYAFELNNRGLNNIRQKARIIQAMAQILSEVDYLRAKNRSTKDREEFLKSAQNGGVGNMNMKTPEFYMNKYRKIAEDRLETAKEKYDENPTKVRERNFMEAGAVLNEVNAVFYELVESHDFTRVDSRPMYRIKVPVNKEGFEMEEVSDAEWSTFEKSGIVSTGRLEAIKKKKSAGEDLNEREQKIFNARKEEFGLYEYIDPISDEEWRGFTEESKIEDKRLIDIAHKLKNEEALTDREEEVYEKASDMVDAAVEGLRKREEVLKKIKEVEKKPDDSKEKVDIETLNKSRDRWVEAHKAWRFDPSNEALEKEYEEARKEHRANLEKELDLNPSAKDSLSEEDKEFLEVEESKPEVISKPDTKIDTAAEEIKFEDVIAKEIKEITKDEWEVLDLMVKDFEKKATAKEIDDLEKESRNVNAMSISRPTEKLDLKKLDSPYAKIMYKRSEKNHPDRMTYRHLDFVREKLEDLVEKKKNIR